MQETNSQHQAEPKHGIPEDALKRLCDEFRKYNRIAPELFDTYHVKRGLRNEDGTGVLAGLTLICNVHGYIIDDNEKLPVEGDLIYRGISIRDLVAGCEAENRFGFEEVIWLLLFGRMPDAATLNSFTKILAGCRELPTYFTEDVLMKAPSANIMNQMGQAVLALYAYDKNPDENSIENMLRQSIWLIARMPTIMVNAYQVKRRHFDHESLFFHPLEPGHSTAESILATMRPDKQFTDQEAKLLDICLMLHAEHGGGNNSSFACRVLSSTGSDTYAAISGALGSLKGPRHGGANAKVMQMMEFIKKGVKNWNDDDEIASFLAKILRKEAGDGAGLIYGMGHAVYTLSDPRAVILKKYARALADQTEHAEEFHLLESVERLSPAVFAQVKGSSKDICANVDLYSGTVYKVLGLPPELYTPLFAVARIAGWCAHRIEEMTTGNRIMRPAYKSVSNTQPYVPLAERTFPL
ncbi:citrate/2-methylcitrate synthase [Ethanoligenens sp.]|uniref:citrate/2-methylcitrate synthase n=1 Tax=Ethanoligenens sp. TaxID=2099655 RepID=UPI0039EB49C3